MYGRLFDGSLPRRRRREDAIGESMRRPSLSRPWDAARTRRRRDGRRYQDAQFHYRQAPLDFVILGVTPLLRCCQGPVTICLGHEVVMPGIGAQASPRPHAASAAIIGLVGRGGSKPISAIKPKRIKRQLFKSVQKGSSAERAEPRAFGKLDRRRTVKVQPARGGDEEQRVGIDQRQRRIEDSVRQNPGR